MSLATACSACGHQNRSAARFCAGCGAALQPATPPMPGPQTVTPAEEPPSASPAANSLSGFSDPPAGTLSGAVFVPLPRTPGKPPQPGASAAYPNTPEPTQPIASAPAVPVSAAPPSSANGSTIAPGAAALPTAGPFAVALASGRQPAGAPPISAVSGSPSTAPVPAFVPGPVHRETFYAAQRRHRRRARLLSVVCVLPVAVLAVLVAALISPWLYLLVAGVLRLLRLAGPLGGPAHGLAEAIRGLLYPIRDAVNHKPVYPEDIAWSIAGLLVPSIVVLFLTWLWVRLRFRQAGSGGVLLSLGAREPNPLDLEERRLVDVTQEAAIAAGLPAPRVLLIDTEATNAAVVGTSHRDFTVVVARPLLDSLNRDETLGVVADLVASAGNGDLGLALTILSVFQTIGLVLAGRDVLLSGTARRTVWRFLAFSVRPGGAPDQRAARASAASDLMLRSTTIDGLDTARSAPGKPAKDDGLGPLGCILVWPYLASAMFRMFMLFYLNFITGPLLGWIWRTRRYLADATAVQITRNPDGLGGALMHLGHGLPTAIVGGASASHLFFVKPAATGAFSPEMTEKLRDEFASLRQRTQGQSLTQRIAAAQALQVQLAQRMAAERAAHPERAARQAALLAERKQSLEDELGMHGLHPPIDKRLRRLEALGAHIAAAAPRPKRSGLGRRWLVYGILGVVLVPVAGLLLLCFGMIAVFAGVANFLLSLPVLLLAAWLVSGALH